MSIDAYKIARAVYALIEGGGISVHGKNALATPLDYCTAADLATIIVVDARHGGRPDVAEFTPEELSKLRLCDVAAFVQARLDGRESRVARLRAAGDACLKCSNKMWPEFQADPTPAWWHDNRLCAASAIYCAEPLLSPWTTP